ncbi:MAG: polysaccharide deacetylase family protein [Kiritimatiellae bacterium]|nr:polysaccharide deacetylase family protein [Kiritimatiellia bacterium]
MKSALLAAAAFAAALPSPAAESDGSPVRIARWKGDAKGAISLYYDDGTGSSFKNALPELVRRGLPGTFYICGGWFGGEDDPNLVRWGTAAKEHPDIVFLGDHTWNHGGVTNAAQFAEEVSLNGAMLRKIAGLPEDALLSFALPGAVRWDVKPDEQAEVLAKHHEVLRHDFDGNVGGPKDGQNPTFRMKTAALAAEAFDRAEKNGGWESLIFHGVGGDWITFDLEEHGKMLDDLEARAKTGRLWVGSAIDVHKYETERDGAKLRVLRADANGIDFLLPGLDPIEEGWLGPLYDYPLTIICTVPADWKSIRVNAPRVSRVDALAAEGIVFPVKDGRSVFDLPSGIIGVTIRKAD